jgi:hypothetical protein
MSEMVERVAEAMLSALAKQQVVMSADSRDSVTIDGHTDLLVVARAAILAMMEPTPKMEDAALDHVDSYDAWRAMIGAALSEEKAEA